MDSLRSRNELTAKTTYWDGWMACQAGYPNKPPWNPWDWETHPTEYWTWYHGWIDCHDEMRGGE